MTAPRLMLRVLGEIELARGGERLTLPASKKTRALLAYLAVTGKAHRRERLCSLFWDTPDDPRGALRWSLSKLRAIVDEPERPRIVTDRDTVALDTADFEIDVHEARRRLAEGVESVATSELEKVAALNRGEFLEGLELPNCPDFEAWRAAEREEARALQRRTLTQLVATLADRPAEALPHARALAAVEPYAAASHLSLLRVLAAAGRMREAEEQFAASSRILAEASANSARELDAAWQALRGDGAAKTAGTARVPERPQPPAAVQRSQTIRFCTTADHVRIGYATVGRGAPLVKTANWLNHLEFDWNSPVWRHWIHELSRDHLLVRYDERGNGLSDWDVADISFEAFVRDLETVVDELRLERFTLLGISQGVAVSIAYAVRHPERVERLVLYGGYLKGWRRRGDPREIERREAMMKLLMNGWGHDNPAFRQIFTTLYIPEATPEQIRWFNELQRISCSPATASRLTHSFSDIDVSDLATRVGRPALVFHCRNDAGIPFDQGRAVASAIPNARFVPLESRNHLILEHEPAWARFVTELRAFLSAPDEGESLRAGGT